MSPSEFGDHMKAANLQQTLAPGTLPDGTEPLIFADLKNGIYTVEGVPVAMADLLEEQLDFGTFDPALIEAGIGLRDPESTGDADPCLKQSLASVLPLDTGCTIVATYSGEGSYSVTLVDLPDYNIGYTATFSDEHIEVGDGAANSAQDTDPLGTTTKIAANIGVARLAGSLGGRPVVATDTYHAADPGAAPPFNTSGIVVSSGGVLESVGWYPLQDEADLPMLSAP